jgi:hypothetical protein
MVPLTGHTGVLSTQIDWSNDQSDLMIDIFDDAGTQVSASPARTAGQKTKTLLSKIDKPGTYFIRVSAPGKTDGSPYSLIARWDEPPPPPPQPVAEPEPEKTKKKHAPVAAAEPKPEKDPHPKSDSTIQGRVVSAFRDGEALTLHIDKGSAAGIKVGMHGTVLSGPSGEDPLDGGDFTIAQVLGAAKSIARSSLKSIGKNTRVVITLDQ